MQNHSKQSGWVCKVPHFVRAYCEDAARVAGVKPQRILRDLITRGLEQREELVRELSVKR